MAVGACIALDPRKAEIKGHGFIMLILSIMFLCILAAGAIGLIGKYTSILLLFAGLMVVGFLVGVFTHLMVFLTSSPQQSLQRLELYLEDYGHEASQRTAWNRLQQKDKCCGLTGPADWLYINISIPSSCCHPLDNSGDPFSEYCARFNGSEYIYQQGCSKLTERKKLKLNYQRRRDVSEAELEPASELSPKKTNFKEFVVYIMIFDYLTKIVCIGATLAVAWLLWQ
ncbi:uroplakin-1b-like isoform X2 [Coccinella septempunctata]|nr:uroplakin-1b-like isoform X2 [Coccinella septempunctata]